MPTVRKASMDDVPRLSTALGLAFVDDPVMDWLFPKDTPDQRRLRGLFSLQMRRHLIPNGGTYTTNDIEGGALWAPPGQWRLGPADILRDLPAIVRIFGRRFPVAMRGLAFVEKKHPTAPHWYLATLGTAPDHQGKGVGSALMAPVLDLCDREEMPAYLESSKKQNIPFYSRHGFEITEEMQLPEGPPIWGMWREPRAVGS
jgi:GNAT superfamily N-acetyltransferase